MSMWTELLVIVALTLANGLFAATEIAILSVRKTRLRELAAEGNGAARALLGMRAEPERFLATVQVGITVIGATAAAFGGATVARAFSHALERVGVKAEAADKLGLALVISLISYLTLVLGELVPKSLALRSSERYALLAARPLAALAWLAQPIVWFLAASSNVVLRLFRDRTTFTEARLSKEELQQLVDEAATVGSLDARSGEIASRALEFGDVRVGGLMVPRADMVTLARDASLEDVRNLLLSRPHSRIPVYGQVPDDIVGYVTGRDLIRLAASGEGAVRDIVRSGLFVPEGALAANVLVEMQQRRDHLALVVNEDGTVTGLVTMEDVLEELVGEIFAEHDTPVERFRRLSDGSVVVRGEVPIHEVNRELAIELPEGPGWKTIAGFAVSLAGTFPAVGARFRVTPHVTIEVVEATERRVLAVRIESAAAAE